MAIRGINLSDFIKDIVYPFLANQLYFEKEGEYANGEWEHRDEGIIQFYRSQLDIQNNQLEILILNAILNNRIPARNEPCICKQKKFKKCHYESVQFLKNLGNYRLREDLKIFNSH